MDQLFIDAIEQNPTAGYVTNFCMLAESMHVRESADLEGLSAKDLRILAILLLNGLRDHPAGEMLHQLSGKRVSDRFWLVNAAVPLPRPKRLLSGAIDQVDDEDLWKQVKRFITKNCPPTSHNGGFVANSSEHRKDVDRLMREELGQIHRCKRGRTPSYKDDTWTDWPASAVEKKVFRWLKRFCKRLQKFARRSWPDITHYSSTTAFGDSEQVY
ncbi:hypothetical protein E4U60_007483 [Claviceps pazoutovae]|uniref:Uncharacterized protein n=1 Tax=Claviceps pazoutovae TaxID=1649127 RepID=A0A9P7MFI9_9HYPO|nr:hypothetical protein E4U60_007483 [Claviceps pazoutovae]